MCILSACRLVNGDVVYSADYKMPKVKKTKSKSNIDRRTRKVKSNSRNRRANEVNSCRFVYRIDDNYTLSVSLGTFIVVCEYCNAKLFRDESANFCCGRSDIKLNPLPQLPDYLIELLNSSPHFITNIRKYNNAFALTSLGCNENWDCFTFKICGKLYHRIGSLIPATAEHPQYLQLYFLGNTEQEVEMRKENNNHDLDVNILKKLQDIMHQENSYVRLFKCTYEKIDTIQSDIKVIIRDSIIPGLYTGRSNAPTADEVAIFIPGAASNHHRDIIVEYRNVVGSKCYQRINETHKAYDPLPYPLMFPEGTDGYHIQILKTNNQEKRVSANEFYKYRLMVRDDNYLLHFRQLLNVYIVDMWAKIESEKLLWISLNQKKLRVEQYIHLQDAYRADPSLDNIGKLVILPSTYTSNISSVSYELWSAKSEVCVHTWKLVILPSTYTEEVLSVAYELWSKKSTVCVYIVGSPRYMLEKSQDALCYVRKFGSTLKRKLEKIEEKKEP